MTVTHDELTSEIGRLDAAGTFAETRWERGEETHGVARAMIDGATFDLAGIDRCFLQGAVPALPTRSSGVPTTPWSTGARFFAAALNLQLMARHRDMPAATLAIRYVEIEDAQARVIDSWFGGLVELSSPTLMERDAQHLEQQLRRVCDDGHPSLFPAMRLAPDDQHACRTTGINFDRLHADDAPHCLSFDRLTLLMRGLSQAFGVMYCQTLARHRSTGDGFVHSRRFMAPVRSDYDFAFRAAEGRDNHCSFEAQLAAMLAPRAWIEQPQRP